MPASPRGRCKWWLRIQRWKGVSTGYRYFFRVPQFCAELIKGTGSKVMYPLFASLSSNERDGIMVWLTSPDHVIFESE